MDHPLKEFFERLGIDFEEAADNHIDCEVEISIPRLQVKIADTPTKDTSSALVMAYGLNTIRKGGKALVKQARKRTLELELRLLDKPDDVDLSSDEYQHIALHLEEEQLQIEATKREGNALLVFCDFVESNFEEGQPEVKQGARDKRAETLDG